MMSHITEIAEQ